MKFNKNGSLYSLISCDMSWHSRFWIKSQTLPFLCTTVIRELYNFHCSPPLYRSLVTSIFREDYDWKDVRTNVLTMDFLMTKWHDGHYYCLICPSCDITFITIRNSKSGKSRINQKRLMCIIHKSVICNVICLIGGQVNGWHICFLK